VSAPALSLSLQFADPTLRPLLPRHRIARWIRAALAHPAEITVRFVDADEGLALNREYRGQDHATNVLTFDYEAGPPLVVADLVLCSPVLLAEAEAMRKTVEAHAAHLLVHGTLHAQGWDHETGDADAQAMEARESALLLALGFPDPYGPRMAAPMACTPVTPKRAAAT
jgi:probable rRNA maturation factor